MLLFQFVAFFYNNNILLHITNIANNVVYLSSCLKKFYAAKFTSGASKNEIRNDAAQIQVGACTLFRTFTLLNFWEMRRWQGNLPVQTTGEAISFSRTRAAERESGTSTWTRMDEEKRRVKCQGVRPITQADGANQGAQCDYLNEKSDYLFIRLTRNQFN